MIFVQTLTVQNVIQESRFHGKWSCHWTLDQDGSSEVGSGYLPKPYCAGVAWCKKKSLLTLNLEVLSFVCLYLLVLSAKYCSLFDVFQCLVIMSKIIVQIICWYEEWCTSLITQYGIGKCLKFSTKFQQHHDSCERFVLYFVCRGISQIGILKAMHEYDIPIDMVGGTSMGAFVGAAYCRNPTMESVEIHVKSFCDSMGSLWDKVMDLTYPYASMFSGNTFTF